LSILGDVLQHNFVEQHRHGIEVACKGVRPNTKGFEWNGATARERVDDEWSCARYTTQCFMGDLG
jgi:hypothetical protein